VAPQRQLDPSELARERGDTHNTTRMKIAITGCNGRVGRFTVKAALKHGHEVLGIDVSAACKVDPNDPSSGPLIDFTQHPNFTFRAADLSNYDTVVDLLRGSDAVIHLAGMPNPGDMKVEAHNTYVHSLHPKSPEQWILTESQNSNVVLSWNILQASAQVSVAVNRFAENMVSQVGQLGITRVAQASSVNVLRMPFSVATSFDYFPIDEDHPCSPDEPYGLSKLYVKADRHITPLCMFSYQSHRIAETQASSIVRRHPSMRIASLRLSWSVPDRSISAARDPDEEWTTKDLWGYVQSDSVADAFLRAIDAVSQPYINGVKVNGSIPNGVNGANGVNGHANNESDAHAPRRKWTSGHEVFFIVAPEIAHDGDSKMLKDKYYPNVPIKKGKMLEGRMGFFDCSKAKEYLGWEHKDRWDD